MVRPTFCIDETAGEAIAFLARTADQCERRCVGSILDKILIVELENELKCALNNVLRMNVIPPYCVWKNEPQIRIIGYDMNDGRLWSQIEITEEFERFNSIEYASSQDIVVYISGPANRIGIKISIDGFVRRLLGGE